MGRIERSADFVSEVTAATDKKLFAGALLADVSFEDQLEILLYRNVRTKPLHGPALFPGKLSFAYLQTSTNSSTEGSAQAANPPPR